MSDRHFGFEIRLQPGDDGTIVPVANLKSACAVLIDWPHARRGPFYQSAREKVEAAIKGDATTSEAAEAFLGLCQHAGIVVRD